MNAGWPAARLESGALRNGVRFESSALRLEGELDEVQARLETGACPQGHGDQDLRLPLPESELVGLDQAWLLTSAHPLRGVGFVPSALRCSASSMDRALGFYPKGFRFES